jgi:hypothetical protein
MGGKPSELTIKGLDNINVELAIPDPIVTESTANITTASTMGLTTDNRLELVLPQPLQIETKSDLNSDSKIQTQSGIALDVRPLTLDMCINLEFGRLPPTCIRQPYNHHFGLTLFGIEMLGFNLVGESRIVIEDVPDQPHVVWGGEHTVSHPHRQKKRPHAQEDDGGLRIRLD